MATLRWYLDEDTMARALVRGLRARGIDVLTVHEAGMSGEVDPAQLEYASTHQRVLYTVNVGDFCRLHAEYLNQGRSHSGIVVVSRQRYSIGEQVRGLSRLTSTMMADEMRDALIFLQI